MRFIETIYNAYKECDGRGDKEAEEVRQSKEIKNTVKDSFGSVYLYVSRTLDFLFVIDEEIEKGLYLCYKASFWWELANQNDFLTTIEDLNDLIIVEPWNKVYLLKEEIENLSVYLGQIPKADQDILKKILKGSSIPKNKRGLTVPIGDYRFFQNRFHRDEARKVKNFSIKIFYIISD